MISTGEGTARGSSRHTSTSGDHGYLGGEIENEKMRNCEPDRTDRNTGDWYIATQNEQGIADLKIGKRTT
jgi:hypothetical protein